MGSFHQILKAYCDKSNIPSMPSGLNFVIQTLVTQPMMQPGPNRTKLQLMNPQG